MGPRPGVECVNRDLFLRTSHADVSNNASTGNPRRNFENCVLMPQEPPAASAVSAALAKHVLVVWCRNTPYSGMRIWAVLVVEF